VASETGWIFQRPLERSHEFRGKPCKSCVLRGGGKLWRSNNGPDGKSTKRSTVGVSLILDLFSNQVHAPLAVNVDLLNDGFEREVGVDEPGLLGLDSEKRTARHL